MAVSVHSRLLNKSKELNRPFNELFQYYVMERFLYRLSKSQQRGLFVLKGALMFTAWNVPAARATRDIDFLGKLRNDESVIISAIQDICRCPVENDGLQFEPESIDTEKIAEETKYGGIRVSITASFLGNAKQSVQLDIGFGDVVVPNEIVINYPTLSGIFRPGVKWVQYGKCNRREIRCHGPARIGKYTTKGLSRHLVSQPEFSV